MKVTRAVVLFLLLIAIWTNGLSGQNLKPFNLSLVHPANLYGKKSDSLAFAFHISVFYGKTGGLKGLELSPGLNRVKGSVFGVQIGGVNWNSASTFKGLQLGLLWNRHQGQGNGVQLSGTWNQQRGNFQGWQFGWLGNHSRGNVYGAQLSHIWNHISGNLQGIQWALGINSVGENHQGISVSLLSNLCGGQQQGIQWTLGYNYAYRSNGIQIGAVNWADAGGNLQIGLFNYSGNPDVKPLGLVNIVPRGYQKLELWFNELLSYNLAWKMGGERFYSMLSVGTNPHQADRFWSFGWGFGWHFQHSNRFYTDVDMLTSSLQINEWLSLESGKVTLLNQLRMFCGFKVKPSLAFFVGPVMNTLISERSDLNAGTGYGTVIAPDFRTVREPLGSWNLAWWPGIGGGIRFF
jgi:hypothetical protein